jgi:hypothetical protein
MLNLPLALRLEKNKLVSTAPWLLLLSVTLPDTTVLRLARNTENVTFGGNVYTRSQDGKGPRGPILKLKTGSPWGVIVKSSAKRDRITEEASEEIKKQIVRRIRFIELKNAGKLNWQESEE